MGYDGILCPIQRVAGTETEMNHKIIRTKVVNGIYIQISRISRKYVVSRNDATTGTAVGAAGPRATFQTLRAAAAAAAGI
jgi:hypothetical protein